MVVFREIVSGAPRMNLREWIRGPEVGRECREVTEDQ